MTDGARFPIVAVERDLGDGVLVEILGFPELSSFDRAAPDAWRRLRDLAARVVALDEPLDVHRRAIGGDVRIEETTLELDAPAGEPVWEGALRLRFHVVRWAPAEGWHVAFVPALRVVAVGKNAAEVEERLPGELRSALMRDDARGDLRRLVELTRDRAVTVAARSIDATPATPRKRIEETRVRTREESILDQVADDLGRRRQDPAWEVDETANRLAEALRGPRSRSVLLVGPPGTGKTAAALEVVRRRAELGLADRGFWRTSGARLVAGQTGFGMWQDRCQKLVREAARRRAVLLVGSLVELAEVGRSEGNALGMAAFLRPSIARGDLVVVAECTPEELAAIGRQDPALAQAFQRLDVAEPTPERTLSILLAAATEGRSRRVPIDLDALETIDRLHRRYATCSARPGRVLRFLDGLLARGQPGTAIGPRDVTEAFSAETGLPLFLLEDEVRFDPAAARAWFAERLVGQDDAVDLVVDLLATAKAGLGRPGKPIASLLFIGPTGVGKTELAKALAEYLFGSRDRLVRFDLSEFADPVSVRRLVGGAFGSQGLLTARVREQPFSVVLLDEFEKADPSLFDLLLQILGEGRLTDASGRLADFGNSIVVLTSNLGATTWGADAAGFVAGGVDARTHFVEAVQSFLRPELFNRIDRIVPFLPLDRSSIAGIARRQLEDVARRDGIRRRGVSLHVEPGVAEELARRGFDPRYGARPLARTVDRELLAPLAKAVATYPAELPLEARVAWRGDRIAVEVRARPDRGAPGGAASRAVAAAREIRRDAARLLGSAALLDLANRIHEIDRLAERVRRAERRRAGQPPSEDDRRRIASGGPLREVRRRVEEFAGEAASLEERVFVEYHSGRPIDAASLTSEVEASKAKFSERLLDLFAALRGEPSAVTVAVFGQDRKANLDLARLYLDLARTRGWAHRAAEVLPAPGRGDEGGEPPFEVREIPETEQDLTADRPAAYGLVLALRGRFARPLLEPERGRHVSEEGGAGTTCLVETGATPLEAWRPPKGIGRKRTIEAHPLRRRFVVERREFRDEALGVEIAWSGRDPAPAVIDAIERRFDREVRELLER